MNHTPTIRQPIITVAGHVDHGKTSLLDCFRGSSIQSQEAGGITQKISFTKYPKDQILHSCPLIKKSGIDLKIPGFLFIDTPGHAAFTNLRKRGGALADLAILVVDIKEGIKPQTAEVISILKANKTPFVIALNKVDTISGWQKKDSLKEAIETQPIHVRNEFDTCLLTFQGSLQSHGFESELFYELDDFTKKVAIVPCSARTKQGINELIFVLCGLCQKFLSKQLELGKTAKGVILEIKKDRSIEDIEAILYDGTIKENEEIAIATFSSPIVTKVRAVEEIRPLSSKYESVNQATAATGVKIRLVTSQGILPGMPFQQFTNEDELYNIEKDFKEEVGDSIRTDKQGIIIKADSLGSLEALMTLLRQSNIQILKASIGKIGKIDISAAKANEEINPLDSIVVGFNTDMEEEVDLKNVKVLTNTVVYKLIEDLQEWRNKKQADIERERVLELATICKLEILPQFVFRNSNPAIFGVRILAGKLKTQIPLIDENDEKVASVKGIQSEKHSVEEATEGMEIALALPGVTFDRQLKNTKYLYSQLSETQFKQFKKAKDLLTQSEIRTLGEIAQIKQRKTSTWGL